MWFAAWALQPGNAAWAHTPASLAPHCEALGKDLPTLCLDCFPHEVEVLGAQ